MGRAISIYNDSLSQTIRNTDCKIEPSKEDYQYVEGMFRDFGIKDVNVPEFDTISQLQRFTKNTINEYLNNLDAVV